MKRFICLLMFVCLAMSLFACGGKKESGQTENPQLKEEAAGSDSEPEGTNEKSPEAENEITEKENTEQENTGQESAGLESAGLENTGQESAEQEISGADDKDRETDTATAQAAKEISEPDQAAADEKTGAKLLYMGHASIRITTAEGKVIYIDPFAGEGYEPAADLILVTHGHYDHNVVDKVENRNPDCRIITWQEALADGEHQTFDLEYVKVEAVEAGYNANHNVNECVGYVLTFSDGISVYVTGDTSKTEQMPQLAEKEIDYAFFCCDGVYNMDLAEAAECAALVKAKHSIPYHIVPADGALFDRERAEQFDAENRLIIDAGEEIELMSQ